MDKLFLSQNLHSCECAAPNRLLDCMGALGAMRADDFLLYEMNSSSLAQCTADAAKAGEKIAERAGDFDFIGQASISTSDLRKNGSMPPAKLHPFIHNAGEPPLDGEGNKQQDTWHYLLRVRHVGRRPPRCRSLHPQRVRPEGDPQRHGAADEPFLQSAATG